MKAITLVLPLCLLVAACGSDDSVPGNAQLGDLTQSELDSLCNDLFAQFDANDFRPLAAAECLIAFNSSEMTCTPATLEQCVSSTLALIQGGIEGTCALSAGDVADCTATVDEATTCFEDSLENLFSAGGTVDCSDAANPPSIEFTPAQSCAVVIEKCPDLFDVGGGGV